MPNLCHNPGFFPPFFLLLSVHTLVSKGGICESIETIKIVATLGRGRQEPVSVETHKPSISSPSDDVRVLEAWMRPLGDYFKSKPKQGTTTIVFLSHF